MVTLAEVEVAIKANLDSLKGVEGRIKKLESNLAKSATRQTAIIEKQSTRQAAMEERANQRKVASAQKASDAKIKAVQKETDAFQKAFDKAAVASERANNRAVAAAQRAANAKAKLAANASAKEITAANRAAQAEERAKNRAIVAANRAASARIKAAERAAEAERAAASRGMSNTLGRVGVGIGAYLGTREVIEYADAWTSANNKLKAATTITGMQTRSLEDLNKIANLTRSSFQATVDLYAKLVRSSSDVAKSEQEVADATEAVTKAFKAGGSTTQEQISGITQLGQALGSGILQGDELRSIRENAPLIAKAIADEFQTTIGGLKKLGEEGALTSDRVFKAILKGKKEIDAAFGSTNSTIADGFTKINNALTQYIGQTDKANSASHRLVEALGFFADNFDTIADTVLKFAAVISAALIGRAIGGMLRSMALGVTQILAFGKALRTAMTAGSAFAALGVAAGPIGAILGVAAGAAIYFATSSTEAEERARKLSKEMQDLGLIAKDAGDGVTSLANALDVGFDGPLGKLNEIRANLEWMKSNAGSSLAATGWDDLTGKGPTDPAQTISSLQTRAGQFWFKKDQMKQVSDLIDELAKAPEKAEEIAKKVKLIDFSDASNEAKDLGIRLLTVATQFGANFKRAQDENLRLSKMTTQELVDDYKSRYSELVVDIEKNNKRINKAIEETAQAATKIIRYVTPGLDSSTPEIKAQSIAIINQTKQVEDLFQQYVHGKITLEKVTEELDIISKKDSAEPIRGFIEQTLIAIASLKELVGWQDRLGVAKTTIDRGVFPGQVEQQRSAEAKADNEKTRKFLEEEKAINLRTEKEKEIAKLQADIIKKATEAGVKLSAAAAHASAVETYDQQQTTAVSNKTIELIKMFEGFAPVGKWDKNHDRAGYGSDTVTLSDGTIKEVTKGMKVSVEDANRDLLRRIGEFQEGIKKKIGADTFNSMNESQQAALTSIAYNYGSLPDRIVKAIATGNTETIYTAIRKLGDDNPEDGKPNKARREKEADLFATGFGKDVKGAFESGENFEKKLEQKRQEIELLKAETGIRQSLNPLVKDYGGKITELQAAQELLTMAQEDGTAAGLALHSAQELLTGDFSKLNPEARAQAEAMREIAIGAGAAEEASNRLADSQENLANKTLETREFAKDLFGGFISDLKEGKTVAESLSNALGKIGDKLLDIGLNMLFGTGSQANQAGGGLFGGIISNLFGGLFASGTDNTGGRKGQPRGIVHGQEAVIPLPSGGKVPVTLNTPSNPKLGNETQKVQVEVSLMTDESAIAGIADTRIKNAAPSIVEVSVKQGQKETKKNMKSFIANANNRNL